MTIEKYVNIFRHRRMTIDEIREKQMNLFHSEMCRKERNMQWEALEHLRRKQIQKTK